MLSSPSVKSPQSVLIYGVFKTPGAELNISHDLGSMIDAGAIGNRFMNV